MIEHVVVFEGLLDHLEELDRWIADFMTLASGMPGVALATGGRNVNPRGEPYTHLTMLRFVDQAALDAYNRSEAHTRFVARLPELSVLRRVLDSES